MNAQMINEAGTIAIIAVVYASILSQPGEALAWWFPILEKLTMHKTIYFRNRKLPMDHEKKVYYKGIQLYDYEWLYKILGECPKCFAGQVALWYYLISHIRISGAPWYFNIDFVNYSFVYHLTLVSLTILITYTLSHIINKWQQNS